jgi:TonB family protein
MSQRNGNSMPRSLATCASHWLIHHAAARAPQSLSQRLEEEWLADLDARPSALSRLRFALGCHWATQVILREYRPVGVAVSGAVAQATLASAFAPHDSGYLSRRSGTLLLVVCMHAVLFYGLWTTLSHIRGSAIPDPLQNRQLDVPHSKVPPPPLPTPQMNDVKIDVRPPEVNVPGDPDPDNTVIARVVQEPPPPTSPPTEVHVVRQVQGGPGAGFPDADDYYPPLAKRMEEQGAATVQVCVDARGRLTADPTVLQGTGSTRLDEGALKLARAGSGHYRASTADGQPVNSCYPFRIRFQLKN